jgi:hypothetical protein
MGLFSRFCGQASSPPKPRPGQMTSSVPRPWNPPALSQRLRRARAASSRCRASGRI